MMKVRKLSIQQARDLLRKNEEEGLGLDIRIAESHHAPGGGEMIVYNSHLTHSALQFIARRKRNRRPVVDVIVYEEGDTQERPSPTPEEIDRKNNRINATKRAQKISKEVVDDAEGVTANAEKVYKAIPAFKPQDLSKREIRRALSSFSQALKEFRKSTEIAVEEYVENGNTLIMDLITQYELDSLTLKHALSVACFATELASMMGTEDYFGAIEQETVLELLGERKSASKRISNDLLEEKKKQLLKRELVEIFLGGFMHDAGLWEVGLQEGHEIRGATLVSKTPQIETLSESLVDIVLFHSDIKDLSENAMASRIFGLSKRNEVVAFKREYYKSAEDVRIDENLQQENFKTKILPVSIAESYITKTQARTPIPTNAVVTELADYCMGGLFQKFVIALCNSKADVIAPSHAMVILDGHISIHVDKQPKWFDASEFSAVSVGHDDSRQAPHLITIFSKEGDGSQNILDYLSPEDPRLWDRSDLDSRMYIPGGRFRSLSYQVSAILRKDIYEKHFLVFEQEVQRRLSASLL